MQSICVCIEGTILVWWLQCLVIRNSRRGLSSFYLKLRSFRHVISFHKIKGKIVDFCARKGHFLRKRNLWYKKNLLEFRSSVPFFRINGQWRWMLWTVLNRVQFEISVVSRLTFWPGTWKKLFFWNEVKSANFWKKITMVEAKVLTLVQLSLKRLALQVGRNQLWIN